MNEIIINNTTFKVGDKVQYRIGEKIINEGFVCFGLFHAGFYPIHGFYVGDENGKQVSEAGLDEYYSLANGKTHSKDDNPVPSIKSFLTTLCFELGLNTAHDYDGIETEEDIKIYTKAVLRKIRNGVETKKS